MGDSDLQRIEEEATRLIKCRTCKANPSEPCRNRRGYKLSYIHGTRGRDYMEAENEP